MAVLFGKRIRVEIIREANEIADMLSVDGDDGQTCFKATVLQMGEQAKLSVKPGSVILFNPFVCEKLSENEYLVDESLVLMRFSDG